jgi:sporulation related protein
MRTLFFILLLANALFFAWSQYFSPTEAAADGVLARRNEPDKLKIVPPAEPAQLPLTQRPALSPAAMAGCLEWGGFTLADYARAEKALEPLALGARLGQRRIDETAGWWVFVPSQGSRQGALKKAAELKALGLTDYYIIGEEGDSPWALSLGVFRSEQAALARLAQLREKGVRTALVGSRDTVVPRIWLQVKGIDPALEARLKEIARQLEGSELRTCP